VVAGGGPRRELFRRLEFALAARFGGAPRAERIRDLAAPLRNALGNAHKHGNGRDRGKRIEVEVVATRVGAVLAISDEGPGFDVAATVARLRAGEPYYSGQGTGLRALEDARSRVAWEAGGRTLLLRFLPSSPGAGTDAGLAGALAVDLARWCARPGRPKLELAGCVVEAGDAPAPPRVRCLLREPRPGEARPPVRILAGRLFASEQQARADLAAAAALRKLLGDAAIRIPRPLWRLPSAPRLALYDFEPWLDLREYLAQRGAAALPGAARRVATLLEALHRSSAAFPEERWDSVVERTRAQGRCALRRLQAIGTPELGRARDLVRTLEQRLDAWAPRARTPIHGSFGLGCVHQTSDGRFAADRLDAVRRSHPAIDLGGILADLAGAQETGAKRADREAAWQTLCAHYLGGRAAGTTLEEARVFAAAALLARLADAGPARIGPDLDRIGWCLHGAAGGLEAPMETSARAMTGAAG
jgi:anti-sigma regulatory factor (Ser/Thr protein kinase)